MDSVQARRKEFVEYFVDEFEGKLKWYAQLLEEEQTKIEIKDIISSGIEAATGSPAPILNLLTSKLYDYIDDKRNSKSLVAFAKLVYDFKDDDKKKDIRMVLVQGAMDVFQSFEIPFTSLTEELGGPTRAMQKLAKQATHNVYEYFKKNKAFCKQTITEGVVHKSNDLINTYHKTVRIEASSLNTSKLFTKAGIVHHDCKGVISFYTNDTMKGKKYGYRRLFTSENENILHKYKLDKYNDVDKYRFQIKIDDFENECEKMLKDLNERDPDLMEERLTEKIDSITKDIMQELTNGVVKDILQNMEHMESTIKKLMEKLNETNKNEGVQRNRIQINMMKNNIDNFVIINK